MSMTLKLGICSLLTLMALGTPAQAEEKKKLDLDDLNIKGEIHNDDRLLILSRQKNEMKNYVRFRTNYREEILQELPPPRKKYDY